MPAYVRPVTFVDEKLADNSPNPAHNPAVDPSLKATVLHQIIDYLGDLSDDNLAEINTALAGKAASSHTHAQADVTGLVTALAGKSDTSHTHSDLQPKQETVKALANAGSAHTIPDPNSAESISRWTLNAASTTPTFPTAVAGKSMTAEYIQDATGSRTITWPGNTVLWWPGGTAVQPTATASARSVFSFLCTDGTHWIATALLDVK